MRIRRDLVVREPAPPTRRRAVTLLAAAMLWGGVGPLAGGSNAGEATSPQTQVTKSASASGTHAGGTSTAPAKSEAGAKSAPDPAKGVTASTSKSSAGPSAASGSKSSAPATKTVASTSPKSAETSASSAPGKSATAASTSKSKSAEKSGVVAKTVAAGSTITPVSGGTRAASKPPMMSGAQEERVVYHYNALGRRDPFQPLIGGGFVGKDVGGDAPPDVGGIRVVGIIWGTADKFALAEDARGNSLVLRQGDKVMDGVVEGLKRDALIVKLTVDGQSHTVTIPVTRKGESNVSD